MSNVLVINSGSSSIKYQIIDMATEEVLGKGLVERIGEPMGRSVHTAPDGSKHELSEALPTHTEGMHLMMRQCGEHGPNLDELKITVVGHRIVQGADRFDRATVVNDRVIQDIEEVAPLAPLHNPAHLLGLRAAMESFPGVPHVVVFDTAFHQTLPPAAYTYAIPPALAEEYHIRRYGAHGISHKFVSEKVAHFMNRPLEELNTIVLHIGNGASACAVKGGRSFETSMGLTPLEGLVMGTRTGDIDPSIYAHLSREADMSVDEIDTLLNKKSGMQGLCGMSDFRDIEAAINRGDEQARLAMDVYVHRLRKYIGAYAMVMGGLDTITFTAGIGENADLVRRLALTGLEGFGIHLDERKNAERSKRARLISTADSTVAVLVVPTNEELAIAKHATAVARSLGVLHRDEPR